MHVAVRVAFQQQIQMLNSTKVMVKANLLECSLPFEDIALTTSVSFRLTSYNDVSRGRTTTNNTKRTNQQQKM